MRKERPSSIHKKAKEKEPKITKDISAIVSSNGCKMHGLENRLKSLDSITRKSKLGKKINDAVRYTAILGDSDFVKNYKDIKSAMRKKGYYEISCKNYFEDYRLGKVNHKSVQCNYVDKDGYIFEMQFQTKASQNAKDEKVPLYEEARDPNTNSKRKEELVAKMRKLADKVLDPPGIEKIKSYDLKKDVAASNNIYKTLSEDEKRMVMGVVGNKPVPKKYTNELEYGSGLVKSFMVKHGDVPISVFDIWKEDSTSVAVSLMTRSGNKYRGKGYSKQNIDRAMKYLDNSKYENIYWDVRKDNAASKHLAKEYGFKKRRGSYNGTGWETYQKKKTRK